MIEHCTKCNGNGYTEIEMCSCSKSLKFDCIACLGKGHTYTVDTPVSVSLSNDLGATQP